ncbi:MAG: hypothetical protein GW803_04420 [Caldiserica bacterium]|nr:hypothetical protein [Caldisericota bacterium]
MQRIESVYYIKIYRKFKSDVIKLHRIAETAITKEEPAKKECRFILL